MATTNGKLHAENDTATKRNHSESGSETEIDVHYEPIVSLPEVEISTNEENEDVMLKLRAKLYRFDYSDPESPEWKERGTGEMKFLHHRDRHTVRIVMRRDKTLKVCANHFITPYIELKPSTGSEKAWVYKVPADFADELAKEECLAIKFASVENAKLFRDTFNEAKELIRTKCSLYASDLSKDGDDDEDDDDEEDEDRSGSEAEIEDNDKSDAEIESEKVADKLSELKVNSK